MYLHMPEGSSVLEYKPNDPEILCILQITLFLSLFHTLSLSLTLRLSLSLSRSYTIAISFHLSLSLSLISSTFLLERSTGPVSASFQNE